MSAAAVIDSLEFARSQHEARGSLSVDGLSRLEDLLFDQHGTLHYELRGTQDSRKRPQLALTIKGQMHLQCQRCLGLLVYEVDVANTLLLLPRGTEPDEKLDDPDGPDAIEASTELNIAGLVEDELLLSLPLSPRHPEGRCETRSPADAGVAGRPKAFAELAALTRPRNTR